jgi:hypothetical protein
MAKKRYRDFLRIAMTAKTARWLEERLVDKTFEAHSLCIPLRQDDIDVANQCGHYRSRTIFVARAMESGLKIGKKRATLDVKCPYSTSDAGEHIKLLLFFANRIRSFSSATGVKRQVSDACFRIADAITTYANRNAMQVIAEAAS